jgi:hypothetical protein
VCKKFEGLSMKADIVSNDLASDNFQAKHVANIKWDSMKLSVGLGMGKAMYEWINQSFKKAYSPRNGAVTVGTFDFKAHTRLEFQHALITSCAFPKLSGDSKDALYLDIEAEPEIVRYVKAGGEDIRGNYGTKHKNCLAANFRAEVADLPCARVASVDAFTWKCEVAPDMLGVNREPTKHPCKVTIPDITMQISMADYDPWEQRCKRWFIDGQHLAADEMQGSVTLLRPNMKDEVGRIDFKNMGFKEFSRDAFESNKTGIARFKVVFYVEGIDFTLKDADA